MIIQWQVNDGYVSGERPQQTEVPDYELVGLTDEEKERLIAEYIQEDFE